MIPTTAAQRAKITVKPALANTVNVSGDPSAAPPIAMPATHPKNKAVSPQKDTVFRGRQTAKTTTTQAATTPEKIRTAWYPDLFAEPCLSESPLASTAQPSKAPSMIGMPPKTKVHGRQATKSSTKNAHERVVSAVEDSPCLSFDGGLFPSG
mmetsp:Transcript_17131/g.53166  ORF Transcript_17131/g.53166 Transcript_17131/m.53166 type:complete len:152 (-) Transcript_17131:358-813(-)